MKRAAIAVALTWASALSAKDMVAETLTGPVNLVVQSDRPLVEVESCIANRWGATPITTPSGVRLIFSGGTAVVDLTPAEAGTSIAIRAWRIERARIYRTVRNCAKTP